MSNTWWMGGDTAATQHSYWSVYDGGTTTKKVWWFGMSGVSTGLATAYEERGPGDVALMHTDYTWTTDALGSVYVGTVVNTRNPGSSQVQSKSTQTLDTNGNLTQSAVYDYGNLSTPVKTYAYTYLADPNYTSRYILNRVAQVTMTPAVGSPVTLVTNTYDNYLTVCAGGNGMVPRAGSVLHDDSSYGTGFTYRGNATQTVSVGGSASMRYESTGVVVCSQDGAGHTTSSAPSADTNYSLPGVLTPGGNSNLATTVTYTSSWAVTSVTGPNGANGTTTYDNFGRPQSTKIPDGAEIDYTYAYLGLSGATANQQTATLGTGTTARWKRTTLDGFGRVTRVENGNGPTTNAAVSQVDTQYAACACSPLGKVSQVSMPYAPGGTPAWTVYTYDGSGRTLTVTAPDGSVTRTEYLTVYGSYTGNLVRVTDAAGKWKIQQSDALGNLVRVIEPDPAGGADWITNYTYDALGHLIGVSMPRSNGTQTRTFAYTGTDLTSATNPENGTVTYQYDGSHHVTKRTDALGQETRYTYDAYGRLTEVQHWAVSYDPHTLTSYLQEQTSQRVDYYYDSNPLNGGYSQNAWGRLAAVTFQDQNFGGPFAYMYSYNQAGRVTAQHMSYSSDAVHFDAAYGWDTEGRMTSINYGPQYQLTYDANGLLGGMSGSDLTLTASYGPAGEMLGLSYQGSYGQDHYNETRTYNPMLQLTRMTVAGTSFSPTYTSGTAMDMQYIYTAGQNNGRIVQSVDGAAGETVNYTYDALNRLATAGATSGTWGQAFAYDGFGNLTGKTVTQGSAPTLSVSFDPMTNHQNGQSYDANGNPVGPTYDIENRMIAGSGAYYAYDHAGKRVKKVAAGTQEYYFYGIGGQKLATMVCVGMDGQGCGTTSYNVYFGGKLVKSKGAVVATDRLGSVRASSTGDRMTYYPYGEERTSTADGREKFGTYMRDNVSQDYADQRYYAVGMGRFGTPDPSSGSDPSDPSSWNRYGYVGGDPVNFNDPTGQDRIIVADPIYFYCASGAGERTTIGVCELVRGLKLPAPLDPLPPAPMLSKVTNMNQVAARLQSAIGQLHGDCLSVLPSKQTLLSDAEDLEFFDARSMASGSQTVAQITPNLAPYNPSGSIESIVGTSDAVILFGPPNGPAKSISSTVILGKQFFLDPTEGVNSNMSVGQGTVLVHELLHYAVQMGDDAFASSYGIGKLENESSSSAINRWLQNGCKN